VINNFSTGGAQSSARRLLRGLAEEDIRVRAAVLQEDPNNPTPGCRALTKAGIDVLLLPRAGTGDPALAVDCLLESIDEDPPEAVLLWNVIAEHKVLLADGLLDVPLFDVSPGEMYFSSLERYFARPRPGLPYRTSLDYGARLAGVIVKYHAEAQQAARTLGAPVHVIPNGVPLQTELLRTRVPGQRLILGTAARISPQKKLEELLLALRLAQAHLPSYVLRIAGGLENGAADYANQMRQLAKGLSVEWVGEPADMRLFLAELDLFVMIAEPAGCPNASLEAMAAGLAVVATDVGGMSEQVEDGVTGRLVPRADGKALAEALIELAANPTRRAAFGAVGRARVETFFDERRMVADYGRVCLGR
jgi:glycosyltransferase involved in cell wall biosynthesis